MPRSAVNVVCNLGHEVELARDIGLGDAPDSRIAEHAIATSAVLVTRDLDFADIRRHPPERYDGIVVLRLSDDATADDVAKVFERFLRQPSFLNRLRGHLAIVEPERVRFRPALIQM